MSYLFQRYLSAGLQVRQPALVEGERNNATAAAATTNHPGPSLMDAIDMGDGDYDEDDDNAGPDDSQCKIVTKRNDNNDDGIFTIDSIPVRTVVVDASNKEKTHKGNKSSEGDANTKREQVQQQLQLSSTPPNPNPTTSLHPISPTSSSYQQPISIILKTKPISSKPQATTINVSDTSSYEPEQNLTQQNLNQLKPHPHLKPTLQHLIFLIRWLLT